MTASFPSARSPSAAPSSEPSASPSGFSCADDEEPLVRADRVGDCLKVTRLRLGHRRPILAPREAPPQARRSASSSERRARPSHRMRTSAWASCAGLSSRLMRAWRTPCAEASPTSVARRCFSFPRTDTNTVASPRSGVTFTPVTVTRPIRGSFRSPDRVRDDGAYRLVHSAHPVAHGRDRNPSVVRRDEQTIAAHEHPVAGGEPALGSGGELLGVVRRTGDARHGQRRRAARGRGDRPRRPRRRSGCAGCPSPSARSDACPSATTLRGSAARR